jgi:uncharacterized RDD family membrane protein YckC
MKVIEPSEIIVEQPERPREDVVHVNPWIRFLARWVDYALFFLLLLASRKIFHGHLPFGKYENLVPFEYFVWIPFEAILLSTWGKTPGKWFLKTRLKAGKRGRLAFVAALRRSFAVWLRGLGLGIPVINFFCMLVAYNRLKLLHITSWDRDDHVVVTHAPMGRWRIYVAVFIATAGILYYYSEKHRELQHVGVVRPFLEYPLPETPTARLHLSA